MTRVMRVPHVEMFKITAAQVLEHSDWLGSRIPLIPIQGEELNVDGKPCCVASFKRGWTRNGW